ncbi:G-protein coupled estrogen receptor 1-like [Physella acuta]|uniref:G-protein coupled estrogen receptor 1-like n=1 Tax=Physella acuta TaxID=109671 RepID=UPI0027DC42DA|nr:G-protein coupled estrogen receptor 1-like [Physella acuta]
MTDLTTSAALVVNNLTRARRLADRLDMIVWRVWVFGLGGCVVCCLGIISNLCAIVVLAHFRKKSSAPLLLIFLAVLDALYLLYYLFLENLNVLSGAAVISPSYRAHTEPVYSVLYPLPHLLQTAISYTVVILSLERYLVVACPLTTYRLNTVKMAIIAMVSILVFAVVYQTPHYMAYKYDYLGRNNTGPKKTFHRTEFGTLTFYNSVYNRWLNLTVNFLLPFAALVTLNGLLVKVLNRDKKDLSLIQLPSPTQRRSYQEHRLTLMVISMTAIFFLCELIEVTSFILTVGMDNFGQTNRDVNRFSALADLIVLTNSAINFLIYCVTGRKFRDTFRLLFWKLLHTSRMASPKLVVKRGKSDSKTSHTSGCQTSGCAKKNSTELSVSSSLKSTKTSTISEDSAGRPVKREDSAGRPVKREDSAGRPVKREDSAGRQTYDEERLARRGDL